MYERFACRYVFVHKDQKMSDPLEQQLWKVVSHHVDAGNGVQSSASATNSLNPRAVSPAPSFAFLFFFFIKWCSLGGIRCDFVSLLVYHLCGVWLPVRRAWDYRNVKHIIVWLVLPPWLVRE